MGLLRALGIAAGVALVGCASVQQSAKPAPEVASSPDFMASAQQHIAAREYWASQTRDGLQAPNRKHDLRSYFEPTGVRVHERTGGGSPRLVELRLAGVGRGNVLAKVPPGEVSHHQGRVEIRRPGLIEWYENSPKGLEQGFTLAERPVLEQPGELILDLAVKGAKANPRGPGAALATATGRKLAYGKLAVTDAAGKTLSAHMKVPSNDRIQIVVADADAVYPIVVDPLLEGTADTQLASDQLDAAAGYGVAGAGDVNGDGYADVLVGAFAYDDGQTDEGAAFLFLGGPGGITDGDPISADAVLTGEQAGAEFGFAVSSAGDVNDDGYDDVIIGARYYDTGQTDEGAGWIFHGSASGLVGTDPYSAATQIESNQTAAGLGYSVTGAGDVNGDGYDDVILGAPLYDAGQTDEGAAFIFHGSASGVSDGDPTTAPTQIEANQGSALLGGSVAGAGDVNGDGYSDVIVGAERYDVTFSDAGVAAIFLGGPTGVEDGSPSSSHGVLAGNQADAWMGYAVASAGDVNGDGYADVMASAPRFDSGQLDEGIISILFGSAAGIPGAHTPSTADDGIEADQASAFMGERLGRLGDVNGDGYADIAVGAHLFDDGQTNEGCVLVFYGSPDGITASSSAENPSTSDIAFCSDQAGAEFGANVTGAGDVDGDGYADLLVGAYQYDDGQSNEGAAFVYRGGAEGIVDGSPTTAHAQLESDQASGQLGHSVASAGDVNGDGYADVIVGSPFYDDGQTDEGLALIFLGGPTGIADGSPSNASGGLHSDQAGATLGYAVASAGDVNGDGYADVIVGAYGYDAGQSGEGAAFVFLGSPTGIGVEYPATAHAQLESDQAGARMGWSVASAGDVNGDGYADVIVGAETYDAGQSDEGAAFVFLGSPTGIADGTPATAHAQLESDQASALMGHSVASAGDVNGDGYGDVIAGAYLFDAGQTDEGAAFVFLGSSTGIADANPATADAQLESDQASGQLGHSVASAGDVNGDGFADVIVGALDYDSGQTNEGAAFVFLGSPTGIADATPATAHAQFESDQSNADMGYSVASAGDVNGDGFADVVVGAIHYDAGNGSAFIFLGSSAGIADATPATADAQLSDQLHYHMGSSVASAGDVNGDGYADVIVGAPFYDAGQGSEGAAFVFLGNSEGRPTLARQKRAFGPSFSVQPWGDTDIGAIFRVEMRGSHPAGVGRVRAEVEACPNGTAFGDVSCTTTLSPNWTLLVSGTDDALLDPLMGLSTTDTLYRWRARVQYADATGTPPPNPAHGPWRRLGAQSVEADIRAVPEPGMLVLLVSGLAGLTGLHRWRERKRRAG